MKFETQRIYLVKWRFWFVVWSKNFATVATWPNKKNNNNRLARAHHTFLYISFTLFCTTTMWNFLAHFMLENVVCAHRCFFVFLFTFFFYTAAHFHLVGRLFSFPHRHFHVFPPTKFVSCFFSNALALLLMSLKTLKFSRTWLCCWFFSLLSLDGLSLSKKSVGT